VVVDGCALPTSAAFKRFQLWEVAVPVAVVALVAALVAVAAEYRRLGR